jgi:Polyketide cyclase / dehydrase and lipid transport
MRNIRVEESFVSSADPEAIYSLVKNSAAYPFWSMIDEFEMVRQGKDEPHGVGAQRIFRTGRNVMHEEVVELIPDRLTAYVLLSGFPMNEYRAETLLDPLEGGGTRITWRCSFYPTYLGTGWFWRLTMCYVLRRFVRDLARASEKPKHVWNFSRPRTAMRRQSVCWPHEKVHPRMPEPDPMWLRSPPCRR